ncbi:unnamed protein product [Brassica oleracea]
MRVWTASHCYKTWILEAALVILFKWKRALTYQQQHQLQTKVVRLKNLLH